MLTPSDTTIHTNKKNDAKESVSIFSKADLALDKLFIEKMKSNPHQWNSFLQKGRALYALSKALKDIGTS